MIPIKILNCKIPATTDRVYLKTDPYINGVIRNQTICNLKRYKDKSKEELSKRIKELNEEWDTERILEANAASIILLSSLLGIKSKRCWFLVTGVVSGFLLSHVICGWCPPLPILRKLGVRTPDEINTEKLVLKMLRGDFGEEKRDIIELFHAAKKQ